MRVQLAPGDKSGCRYYRIALPAQALGDEVDTFEMSELQVLHHPETDEMDDVLPEDEDVDVVVIQRPTNGDILKAIPMLQANGVAVVVEMDDDLSQLDREHVAWASLHPTHSPHMNYANALKAAKLADWVTVSTPRLAEVYGKHGRVSVIRNYIDDAWMDINVPPPYYVRMLGWSGTVATHPRDLNVVGSAARDAVRDAGAHAYIVGGREARDVLGFSEKECGIAPWVQLEDYPYQLGMINVGMVPLANSKFNEAKSWLKGLEFAAMGAPFVATPMPEYERLTTMLPWCETAKKYGDWRKKLARLLSAPDLAEISESLRACVREDLVISKHAHEYAEAWEKALAYRRSIVPERRAWPLAKEA